MGKIKGKDLIKLGFKKEKNIPTSAQDMEYHYYTYSCDVKNKDKCLLITCSNDDKENGGYFVEFYDMEGVRFYDLEDVKELIKLLKKATV